jgi:hypothetical protein
VKEVRLLETTQIRLFPPDVIPLMKIPIPQNGKKIQSLFDFQVLEPIEDQGIFSGISFNGGTLKGDPSAIIDFVRIEGRRIAVKVHGTSDLATSVFDAVANELQELNNGQQIREIVCTHETATSVVLSFPFDRVLSNEFVSFLNKSANNYTKNQWAENLILPASLKFAVRYRVTDDALIKSNITLSPKALTIEPRAQSSPEEKLYWVVSPTDTDTHFKLIEDLERALSK